ncbi:MAG: hypothetical protein FD165_2128 [Gammaproteobacteria bacterium]|nr:MAG: hypothetical protein FD165_2128 [Gammaproteobacteria bacterium]TND05287.1 MAG: hypothetical protein FD120_1162 [Gammaproteobacteria bacterium]
MRTAAVFLLCSTTLLAAPVHAAEHAHQPHGSASDAAAPLTAPGNDAFAAIQEVVGKLLADPDTDWRRVDLEALRRHLVDMHNFTLNVEVTSQHAVDGGVEFTVEPATPDAAGSLDRLFSAHPAILKQESGWDMTAKKNPDGGYTARVTGAMPEDTAKIRGLGYIGIIAFGQHHQAHHWQMVTSTDPHRGH